MEAWTVRFTDEHGDRVQIAPTTEQEAKDLLDGVRTNIDPGAVLTDLTAEAMDRLPVGGRVRHTTDGRVGVVVTDPTGCAPFPRIVADAAPSHVVTSTYTAVCVRWDGRSGTSWWDAAFIASVTGGGDPPR